MNELQQQLNELFNLFRKHTHSERDFTTRVDLSRKLLAGNGTPTSGVLTITDNRITSNSICTANIASGTAYLLFTSCGNGACTITMKQNATTTTETGHDEPINYIIIF